MIGAAIKTILATTTANVCEVLIPHARGARWVSYRMISNLPYNTKSGVSSFDWYRFQIDIFARTYAECDTLAAAVRTAMDDYSGTASSVVIDRIYFDGEWDTVESVEDEEAREDYFRRSQDYMIAVKT
jgi:hypothetical protein